MGVGGCGNEELSPAAMLAIAAPPVVELGKFDCALASPVFSQGEYNRLKQALAATLSRSRWGWSSPYEAPAVSGLSGPAAWRQIKSVAWKIPSSASYN